MPYWDPTPVVGRQGLTPKWATTTFRAAKEESSDRESFKLATGGGKRNGDFETWEMRRGR